MLNRTVLPESGSILYCGKKIEEYAILDYRKEVLLVPQEIYLLDATIRENFDFYYKARKQEYLSDQEILMKNIQTYCNQVSITTICVSHNNRLVETYADEVILVGGS